MSTNRITQAHPFYQFMPILKEIFEKLNAPDVLLSFKEYQYVPAIIDDQHKIFSVPLYNINEGWLFKCINSIDSRNEFAINSSIYVNGKVFHIAMVDLGVNKITPDAFVVIHEFMEHWKMDFLMFESGRSLHLYGEKLLEGDEQWVKFMGSLLLLNKKGGRNLIDTRWVGHRILAGYSSLRWSNNTLQYKRYPKYIGRLSDVVSRYKLN